MRSKWVELLEGVSRLQRKLLVRQARAATWQIGNVRRTLDALELSLVPFRQRDDNARAVRTIRAQLALLDRHIQGAQDDLATIGAIKVKKGRSAANVDNGNKLL